MPSQTFVANPLASAGGRVIAAPFQFYVTGEDRLRLVAVGSKTGVTVRMRWRFLSTTERVPQVNEQNLTATSDRTSTSVDVELGSGALLNLTVFASAGAPLKGQTFVIVQIVRGVGSAAIVLGTLLADYVTATQHLGWPGSPIVSSTSTEGVMRVITGTDPAADVVISEVVPTGARWEVVGFQATLATSATAGTRKPQLTFDDGATVYQVMHGFFDQSVSVSIQYNWLQGAQIINTTDANRAIGTLPQRLQLLAGHRIRTAANLITGDNWGAPTYAVREWLEVN
jgi:hypothetical protein